MKRVLLIGFILAICILAFPQGVAADGSAVVTATVGDYLVCGANGGVTNWGLTHIPQDNHIGGALGTSLTSSLPWWYRVSGTNGGKLTAFSGSYDTGTMLADPLNINAQAVTGSPAVLANGNAIIGWTNSYDYNQRVEITDKASTLYKIDLTFTCSNSA
jgi:hypothetical protein